MYHVARMPRILYHAKSHYNIFHSRGNVIAVDGKAIRSTGEKDKPHSALQILSAYLTENGVTLGQESIHEKTNEIPIFQQMLDYLDHDFISHCLQNHFSHRFSIHHTQDTAKG